MVNLFVNVKTEGCYIFYVNSCLCIINISDDIETVNRRG